MNPKYPDRLFPESIPMTGSGMRESQTAAPLRGHPADEADMTDFTSHEWDEVKHLALAIVGTKRLDSPEGHLAYIRGRIMTAGHV